mmetsp:Transcript_5485/g.10303  ORF Transcript_5485/g.10303 Transcript_5485/m.10303 type:complete len:207 (+) Transcript_5485:335-955(+)
MGHFADQHEVRVHPRGAILQAGRHAVRAPAVRRPHGGGEAVLGVIGPPEDLRLGVEARHGDHRAEDLLLDDLVRLQRAGQHRRLEEEARAFHDLAAGDDLDVRLGLGSVHEACDPLAVLLGDEWAQLRLRVVLQAMLDGRDRLTKLAHKLLVDGVLGVNLAGSSAILPSIVIAECLDAFYRFVDVSVVENNNRRFATKLHVRSLHS